jgi:hypothetical protein
MQDITTCMQLEPLLQPCTRGDMLQPKTPCFLYPQSLTLRPRKAHDSCAGHTGHTLQPPLYAVDEHTRQCQPLANKLMSRVLTGPLSAAQYYETGPAA